MMTQTKPQIQIVIENNQPITTSRNVAENFGKQHKHVLEAIDELTKGLAENSANLFYESEYCEGTGLIEDGAGTWDCRICLGHGKVLENEYREVDMNDVKLPSRR